MSASAQPPEEKILALAKWEADVRRFIERQQCLRLQTLAQMKLHEDRRRELSANLAELKGFVRPVVSFEHFKDLRRWLAIHDEALKKLQRTLSESEAEIGRAQRLLPCIEARRSLAVRHSFVLLEFPRPEPHQ